MLSRVDVWYLDRRPTYNELDFLIKECKDKNTIKILYYETGDLGRMKLVLNKKSDIETLYDSICIKEDIDL